MSLPKHVTIVEMGPRDGLQNETASISIDQKVRLVEGLADAGVADIEVGAFVNPKWVPQMANSEAVFEQIARRSGVNYRALVPNLQGYQRALAVGASEVAVFTAASEAFNQKNINCSISQSLERFADVFHQAKQDGIRVRGYVSCSLGCPYNGDVAPVAVLDVCLRLLDLGCYEVVVSDTTGVGTVGSMSRLLDVLIPKLGSDRLALHCHDTYGQALANISCGLQYGIATIDASVAGLGGCPYAPGSNGNVATEDVLYMLNGMGIDTGIDLAKLMTVGNAISSLLDRPSRSRVALAQSY